MTEGKTVLKKQRNTGAKIKNFFRSIKARFRNLALFIRNSEKETKVSMCVMGGGQLMMKQFGRGILLLTAEILGIVYFALRGVKDLIGFFTLGTVKADAWEGVVGDDSVIMLLMGIMAWFALFFLVALYIANVRDADRTAKRRDALIAPEKFSKDLSSLLNRNFYKTVLFVPLVGVMVFSVLPIVFMILIAFTNYGGNIVPPELVDWVGFGNFVEIFALGEFSRTFIKILGWNILWAAASTFTNYFLGLGLALLLNKKCVKGKAIWRAFPVLAYAIPGFITLLGFKFMFSNGGPINQMITSHGGQIVDFFGIESKWPSRLIGFGVNAWISVPSIMLLATGLLSNMNTDLYEAAEIDGASKWVQFRKITLPFVLFSTTPVLISQFIGNFNNFGIFYFLRDQSSLSDGYFLASDTDLLINWLYRLSIDNTYYSKGAAISLMIFIITSVVSLVVYVSSSAYKKEDTFR